MQVFRCLSIGIALGCLPLTTLAQRQLVVVTLPAQQPVVQQLIAPALDFVEVCTAVRAGRPIIWQFKADAPLTFNTHFHDNGDVQAPESMSSVSAAQGRISPKSDNEYCWLWSNRSARSIAVRMQLGP